MEEKKGLKQKLFNIMEAIDYIQKDKTNDFHHYNYASERAIKEKVHEQLVKEKVLFFFNIASQKRDGNNTTIDVVYRFVDVESSDFFEGTFAGSGEDKGDKGLYKAITGSIKYILTSTFLIPTGDDPEEEKADKNRDFAEEIKQFTTVKDIQEYESTLNPIDKKACKVLLESAKRNIIEANIETVIDKLQKRTVPNFRLTIEEIIDTKSGEEQEKLIKAYNAKLESLGIKEQYEKRPF